ncbi:hypothetical protein C8Q73DRAFT_711766 [Cubamyces lactineus]|nr:hypothetical protein C8Q73DRAFT_711766 [Cubamyces lactineus]
MTEYDYSPDAYERFQAKMAGVGDWVSEQRHHAPKYSNPFLTEESSSSSSSSRPHTSRADDASRHKHHQDRPQPSRSRTLPNPATGPSAHGHTSRAYAYAQQAPGDPHKSHHRSARSPQRSGSLPPDPRYASASATYAAAPMPAVHHQAASRASPVTYAPPAPAGYRTRQVEYKYVPGQPVVLPPPRPGETYVIIPPKGGRVDVVPDPPGARRAAPPKRATMRF